MAGHRNGVEGVSKDRTKDRTWEKAVRYKGEQQFGVL